MSPVIGSVEEWMHAVMTSQTPQFNQSAFPRSLAGFRERKMAEIRNFATSESDVIILQDKITAFGAAVGSDDRLKMVAAGYGLRNAIDLHGVCAAVRNNCHNGYEPVNPTTGAYDPTVPEPRRLTGQVLEGLARDIIADVRAGRFGVVVEPVAVKAGTVAPK